MKFCGKTPLLGMARWIIIERLEFKFCKYLEWENTLCQAHLWNRLEFPKICFRFVVYSLVAWMIRQYNWIIIFHPRLDGLRLSGKLSFCVFDGKHISSYFIWWTIKKLNQIWFSTTSQLLIINWNKKPIKKITIQALYVWTF